MSVSSRLAMVGASAALIVAGGSGVAFAGDTGGTSGGCGGCPPAPQHHPKPPVTICKNVVETGYVKFTGLGVKHHGHKGHKGHGFSELVKVSETVQICVNSRTGKIVSVKDVTDEHAVVLKCWGRAKASAY